MALPPTYISKHGRSGMTVFILIQVTLTGNNGVIVAVGGGEFFIIAVGANLFAQKTAAIQYCEISRVVCHYRCMYWAGVYEHFTWRA